MRCKCGVRMLINESGYTCSCGNVLDIVALSIDTQIATAILYEIHRYVVGHRETCGFLRSVLENNLRGAFMEADDYNFKTMGYIVKYLWNYAPADCWGSKEIVCQWLKYPRT